MVKTELLSKATPKFRIVSDGDVSLPSNLTGK